MPIFYYLFIQYFWNWSFHIIHMNYSRISGVGHYVPDRVVTNHDLAQMFDTNDEWIVERSGIKERRFMVEGKDTTTSMGYEASKVALERAGKEASEIDMIIFATLSPDYNFPGCGVLLQRMLGLKDIPALDIRQQCAGFVYALSVADQYIKSGLHKNILVVGSEIHSKVLEFTNRGRGTAVLFGDGAGACIVSASEQKGILSTHIHSDGSYAEELMLEHPSISKTEYTPTMKEDGMLLPYMNGSAVFKIAVQKFPEAVQEALDFNELTTEDLDLLIPHQANLRIAQYVQKTLKLREDQVFNNIQKYGNTTAASIPLAMSEAWEQGLLTEGKLICFAAFGSGFVWGSVLLRW